MSTLTNVHWFIRDNLHGDLVVNSGMYKNGDLWYLMESGNKYRIDEKGLGSIHRLNFTPRLHPEYAAQHRY